MPGYFILTHRIDDLERYQAEYVPNAIPFIFKYGGEILAGGAGLQPIEGDETNAVAVIKFPSVEKAEACMSDPDYQPFKKLRHELTSNYNAMIVPHFEMPAS